MPHLRRLEIASAFAFAVIGGSAQAQGDDVAIDFRTTDVRNVRGQEVKGSSTGHAVVSRGRVRLELSGNSRFAIPGATPGSPTIMIMPDSGRTFIILKPDKKQYLQINPAVTMQGARQMMSGLGGNMTFELTGDDPKVENLGAGPDLLGHHTSHYRITSALKMRVGAMGQIHETQTSTVTDEYIAKDVKIQTDPFRALQTSPVNEMFGESGKEYLDKIKRARARYPSGASLRTETKATTSAMGQTSNSSTVYEITRIQPVRATPDLFAVPRDYTKIEMPMNRGGGSRVVPKR